MPSQAPQSHDQPAPTTIELTEQQRNLIRAEEVFREAIRESLNTKNRAQKAWAFLNSSFGLWLLSSIVVGLITWLYSEWQEHNHRKRESQRITQRLDIEIADRLWTFQLAIERAPLITKGPDLLEMLRALDRPQQQANAAGVFTEFSGHSMRALMWQLSEECSEGDVRSAYDATVWLFQTQEPLAMKSEVVNLGPIREQLAGRLGLVRWQKPDLHRFEQRGGGGSGL